MNTDVRAVRPVVDPALGPRTNRWVLRLIARKAWPADKLLIEYLGPVVLTICVLGAWVNGLADPWLLAVAASAGATFVVRREVRSAGLRRFRRSFVAQFDLDDPGSQRLRAAQDAIETVCTSEVYRTGTLDSPVREADLKRHEWEIASRFLDITRRRSEYAANRSEGVPGPHTAAVLEGHARAIIIAQDATSRRVEELQRFANEVRACDLALEDLCQAEKLSLGNDRYLELVAKSTVDEHAIAELARCSEDAGYARDAYLAAMDRVRLAAGPLVLPQPGM